MCYGSSPLMARQAFLNALDACVADNYHPNLLPLEVSCR
jgi:hypothetical protein